MSVPSSDVPETHSCAHYSRHGPPSLVSVDPIPSPPSPGSKQLLVKVSFASLNPADYKSAGGEQALLLSFKWPRVYGFDFSGVVVSAASDCSLGFKEGDEVFGMIAGLPQLHRGTLAEYVLVEEWVCAKKPENVPHNEAASVPLVGITAVKMFRACNADDRASPRVLITGGAGGVGTVAIQLAKSMYKASYVATTASAGVKTELCKSLGADRVVNYREEKFYEVLDSDDESELFDIVLDITGEASRAVHLLRKNGGMCSIVVGATSSGVRTWLEEARISPNDITTGVRPFLTSEWGGSLFNCFGGGRSLIQACKRRDAKYAMVIGTGNGEIMFILAKLLKEKKIKAVIDKEYPLQEAKDAIEYLKKGRAAGKVVVRII